MAHLNRIWSILLKGVQPYSPVSRTVTAADYAANPGWTELFASYFGTFTRKVTKGAYRRSVLYEPALDALVDRNSPILSCLYAEQLVQLLLASDLREDVLAFDSKQLYERATLTFPSASVVTSATPVEVYHSSRGACDVLEEEGIVSVGVSVDPVAQVAVVDGVSQSFQVTGRLSSYIELIENRYIRFQETLPSSAFQFVVIYTGGLSVDWPGMLTAVTPVERTLRWTNQTWHTMWEEDGNWINRLAAITMLAVTNSAAS